MTKVSDFMTRGVRAMSPRDTVEAAARAMDALNVGAMPVCERGRLVGMITERDIAVGAVARGLPPSSTPLGYFMSADPQCCYEDQSIEEVLEKMGSARIRRIPVVDRNRRFVGMLSLGEPGAEDQRLHLAGTPASDAPSGGSG
jgi:CBS domain-containing protein